MKRLPMPFENLVVKPMDLLGDHLRGLRARLVQCHDRRVGKHRRHAGEAVRAGRPPGRSTACAARRPHEAPVTSWTPAV
jgi:hypothetical protein